MKPKFWHYLSILFLLYIFWSGFFIGESYLNQLVFNFAVFYPIGLLDGYIRSRRGIKHWHTVFLSAAVFNVITYFLVFYMEVKFNWLHVIFDFLMMFVIVLAGIYIGVRSSK